MTEKKIILINVQADVKLAFFYLTIISSSDPNDCYYLLEIRDDEKSQKPEKNSFVLCIYHYIQKQHIK